MVAPECARVVLVTCHCIKLQMCLLNGEMEVEVVGINVIDTLVVLLISLTIVTNHDSLHVSSTITVVGNVSCYLCTIHSCSPLAPVAAFLNCSDTSIIASAPTEVVGTQHTILCCTIGCSQHNEEVVPVVTTCSVVGEVGNKRLTRINLNSFRMITPESARIVGSTNRLVHLIYNLKLSSTNDRCVSILTKIGLVIDSYQRLLANAIHIGNSLDLKILALHLFCYAISEGYCCRDISKSILKRGSQLHFGGHAVKLHGHRLAVLHVYVAKLNVAVIHCEGEIEIILIDRDTSVLLCVGIAIRAKHSNLYVCSTITIIIDIHGALGSAHSFQPSSPVSIIALHLLGEMSIALFT